MPYNSSGYVSINTQHQPHDIWYHIKLPRRRYLSLPIATTIIAVVEATTSSSNAKYPEASHSLLDTSTSFF